MLCRATPSRRLDSMLKKLITGAALAAAGLAGATSAKAQSFQSVVETFYNDEFRAHPIAATDIGVHEYDAEVDDLSRDGQAKHRAAAQGARRAHCHRSGDAVGRRPRR